MSKRENKRIRQLERRVAELEKNMPAPDCQIRVDAESCVPEKLAQDIAEAIESPPARTFRCSLHRPARPSATRCGKSLAQSDRLAAMTRKRGVYGD